MLVFAFTHNARTVEFVKTGAGGGDFSLFTNLHIGHVRKTRSPTSGITQGGEVKRPAMSGEFWCPALKAGRRGDGGARGEDGYELLQFIPFVPNLRPIVGRSTPLDALLGVVTELQWTQIASTFDKKVDSFEQFRWLTSPELARAVEGFWERAAASPALPCDRLCSQVISVRHEQGPIAYSLEYCEITSSGYFSMTKPRANVDPHINCTPVLTKARATGAVSFLGKTRPALGCYECADLPSRPPNFAFRCTSSSAPRSKRLFGGS